MSKKIEARDNLLIEMSEDIKNIKDVLGRHEKILNEHSEKLVDLRQNMARMEYDLTERITALFDLGEVFKDKFEETDLRIKGSENTLDWHDRRLMKLEMAD